MKVRYKGKQSVSLIQDKIYEVISVEMGDYRIIDETGDDYIFPADKFEIVEE